ncbi:HPF/RaiA family ribosome-associated protein [Roseiconus nitratireducens]|uniref:HPF/RaiA family ribosome-associated protein n=1 Tax=Roseiconus nitratireducens TaxID=2605748 RepID=A0A5M6D1K3_9BACT|nr:HPF/RaiA family ribosome-associated protein [Roseiconus nitratireducens]KAA5541354.1 HPF/RaiA family ribosome-associated protein [Roseiconus nitratireducens]
MSFSESTMNTDLDVSGFQPSTRETDQMTFEIDRLEPLVRDFPTKTLHVNVKFNKHSKQYETKLALVLPGQTFATGDVTDSWHAGMETSVEKMVRRIKHYKEAMSGEPEHARKVAGTTMNVQPEQRLDGEMIARAIEQDDYSQFRKGMYPIEESLRDRIGRWVQRYPQIQAMLGERFTINDLVEETFMLAFDRYAHWNTQMFFGQWIESLIDPALKAIVRDPDGELEAIRFQQTWDEA